MNLLKLKKENLHSGIWTIFLQKVWVRFNLISQEDLGLKIILSHLLEKTVERIN